MLLTRCRYDAHYVRDLLHGPGIHTAQDGSTCVHHITSHHIKSHHITSHHITSQVMFLMRRGARPPDAAPRASQQAALERLNTGFWTNRLSAVARRGFSDLSLSQPLPHERACCDSVMMLDDDRIAVDQTSLVNGHVYMHKEQRYVRLVLEQTTVHSDCRVVDPQHLQALKDAQLVDDDAIQPSDDVTQPLAIMPAEDAAADLDGEHADP